MSTQYDTATQLRDYFRGLEEFTRAAVECVLWTTPVYSGESEEILEDCALDHYGCSSIADLIEEENSEEWQGFFETYYSELCEVAGDFSQSGHDYVLTAGGHGAGFWDRGYPKRLSDALCEGAEGGTSDHSVWQGADGVLRYAQG